MFPEPTTNHGNAYKTCRFQTFWRPSGGVENTQNYQNAYKTLRFLHILEFLGVTKIAPAAAPGQPDEASHTDSHPNDQIQHGIFCKILCNRKSISHVNHENQNHSRLEDRRGVGSMWTWK